MDSWPTERSIIDDGNVPAGFVFVLRDDDPLVRLAKPKRLRIIASPAGHNMF